MWFDEIDEIFEQMLRTFGNVQSTETGELLAGAREPFTDVIVDEKNSEVIVTAQPKIE